MEFPVDEDGVGSDEGDEVERVEIFVSFTQDRAMVLEDFVGGIAALNAPVTRR